MARRRRVAAPPPPPPPPPPPEPLPDPEPTTDPDEALARLRQAEAMLAAAERLAAAEHEKADAMKAAADAKVDAAKDALQRVRAAALTAAREARRAGRALAQATHASALPADVLVLIASLLPPRDILSMACVCTGWKQSLLRSPSPLFRSLNVSIDKLMSGSTQLAAYDAIQEHAADILSLTVRDCRLRREFACVESLVPSLTRLTHLAIAHEVGPSWRPEWTKQAFRGAAGLTSLRSASFRADGFRGNNHRPLTGAVFSGLGAALARVTALSFDCSVGRYREEVGREDQDWLAPATALRTLDWKVAPLPSLPASLTGLRELKLSYASTVPPPDATPALANVESVEFTCYTNRGVGPGAVDTLLGQLARATRLVVLHDYPREGVSIPASLANARSLRRLKWQLAGDRVAPAASLPALTWLRLDLYSQYRLIVEAGRTSFPALRTLRVNGQGSVVTMPALGPDFAPRLSTLVLSNLGLDLAAVVGWQATALKKLQLKRVHFIVDPQRVAAGAADAADAALADARAAAVAAAEAYTSAQAASDAARQHMYEMRARFGYPPAGERPDVDAARAAADAASSEVSRLHGAKIQADRRRTECAAAVVARDLPAALPAVTRVMCDSACHHDAGTQPAFEALLALSRRGQAAAGGGDGGGGGLRGG